MSEIGRRDMLLGTGPARARSWHIMHGFLSMPA